jgi:hypothetical protein
MFNSRVLISFIFIESKSKNLCKYLCEDLRKLISFIEFFPHLNGILWEINFDKNKLW